jgi:tRNA(Ile)-lysidine synthase
MGPHPAVAAIRVAVRATLAATHGPVYVACSGGADSLALAAALAFEAPRAGRRAGLVTIDHGLQDGSAAQAEHVAAIGRELGLDPVEVIRVEVRGEGGPEAAARTARYQALDALARSRLGSISSDRWTDNSPTEAVILLGHTLDDQAETVLLGLGRGSGPRSIAGMRAVSGPYRRPLLAIRRSMTVQACQALGLTPWADPHNADSRYQRVRLRTEVLPLLEDVLQGGVAEALARTATALQADLDALDELTPRPAPELRVAELALLTPAIRTRVLRRWVLAGGVRPGELSAHHLGALEALITSWRGQGPIQLPGGRVASRSSGTLSLRPAAISPATTEAMPEE